MFDAIQYLFLTAQWMISFLMECGDSSGHPHAACFCILLGEQLNFVDIFDPSIKHYPPQHRKILAHTHQSLAESNQSFPAVITPLLAAAHSVEFTSAHLQTSICPFVKANRCLSQ